LNCIWFTGFLGASFTLAIVIDIFKLITIHTYFFFIYAFRIFQIEHESLNALFRLFRGKKLNPFRNRIDSYSYNVDQLFIGTLGFCIVFFLMPTVHLYFIVFLVLRIGVVVVINFMKCFLKILNNLPIYEFSLLLFKRNGLLRQGQYIYSRYTNNPIKLNGNKNKIEIFYLKNKNKNLKSILKFTQCQFFIDLKVLMNFKLQ
jgi:hypothetical protein